MKQVLTILYLLIYVSINLALTLYNLSHREPLWLITADILSATAATVCIFLYIIRYRPKPLTFLWKLIPIVLIGYDMFYLFYALSVSIESNSTQLLIILTTVVNIITLFPSWYLCFRFGYLKNIAKNKDNQALKTKIEDNSISKNSMTKREFTAIILKLIGIYIFVRYLGSLPSIFSPFIYLNSLEIITFKTWAFCLISIFPPILYFSICFFLIVKSKSIATMLINNDGEFYAGFNICKDDILIISFCCIGLVILVSTIPDLVESGSNLALIQKAPDGFYHSKEAIMAYSKVAADFIQAFIGLGLFLQARGLAGLWRKLRDYK